MKSAVLFLLLVILAADAALAQSADHPSVVGRVPDRLLLTLAPGVEPGVDKAAGPTRLGIPALDAVAQRHPLRQIAPLYADLVDRAPDKSQRDLLAREYAVDLAPGTDLDAAMAAYAALPEVAAVHDVKICKVYDAFLPNDTGLSSQWHLRALSYGKDVRAVGAWGHTLGDSNVVVAVIDTGVDWNHPDLGGPHPDKVNGAIWTNWTEYYGTPGVDDDSNGYVDDIRGWDWVNVGNQGHAGQDDTVADNDPSDYGGHGTNCAGCVAPLTDNSIGVAAAAPGVKIMALRTGYWPNGSTHGVVRMDYCSSAMIYAAYNGARIINASWGSDASLSTAVAVCQASDVLIVNAAGNDGADLPDYLGTRAGVLSVAATTSSDEKASFSNYGDWVELSAPGVGIYTTNYDKDSMLSNYASVQGTSFSAPIVAGAAALVWSTNLSLTYQQVSTILTDACDDIDALNPAYTGKLGAGRLNMLRTVGDSMHRYPEEFPTLYDAMNSSADGDTVGVLGGAVLTDIAGIPGGVKIFGGYSADYLSRDPLGNPAVIQGASHRPAVDFLGAGPGTELDGFRIESGGGSVQTGVPGEARCGGGLLILNASPTLRNLTVTGNAVGSPTQLGAGGGVMLSNSTALLENVAVTGNTAIYGGGLYAYNSAPTLIGCSFSSNTMSWDNALNPPRGGGVYAVDSDLDMTDCVVQDNTEVERGGGIYLEPSGGTVSLTMSGGEISGNTIRDKGAGVFQTTGTADLDRVLIQGNVRSASASLAYGGGLQFENVTVTADSLTMLDNTAQVGAAVSVVGCPDVEFTNSVLAGNAADFVGGGFYLQDCPQVDLIGNTVVDNAGTGSGAGGVYLINSTLTMANDLVAHNTGGGSLAGGVHVATGSLTATCNVTWNNTGGDWGGVTDPTGSNGNVAADPYLCDVPGRDFSLGTTSPCDPAHSGGCGLIGAVGETCAISALDDDLPGGVPTAFRVEQNFPNPFNPQTTIRFALPEGGPTRVTVFDVRGRRVATLLDRDLPAQVHETVWDGRDDRDRQVSTGIYFYRVASGEHRFVGRMALVK